MEYSIFIILISFIFTNLNPCEIITSLYTKCTLKVYIFANFSLPRIQTEIFEYAVDIAIYLTNSSISLYNSIPFYFYVEI
jgi:hypothetical protein